ncbi:hypothetical protein [Vibrio ulleungensis]|uniref:Uncharacterized protein n=1 Tax=Vibrio ulleungensis TaxID=2807619 RepID=A0ABS2HHK1_9VIBR|nr:hypothetical protein [Vibrio ulleungensis]MBM7036566.1 hypothetical protein [Vibrio ulleungensis]
MLKKMFVLLLLFTPMVHATQESEVLIINKALEVYVDKGTKGIEEHWPMPNTVDVTPFVNTLTAIEKYYGDVIDYDLIKVNEISERVRVAYFALNYNEGAAFLRVQTYLNHENRVLFNYLNVHTEYQTYFSDK